MNIEKLGEPIVKIRVYATSDDAEVIIKEVCSSKKMYLLGDFNTRVDNIVEKYGVEKVNNNGQRLIDLCETLQIKIMNELYPHNKTETTKGKDNWLSHPIWNTGNVKT